MLVWSQGLEVGWSEKFWALLETSSPSAPGRGFRRLLLILDNGNFNQLLSLKNKRAKSNLDACALMHSRLVSRGSENSAEAAERDPHPRHFRASFKRPNAHRYCGCPRASQRTAVSLAKRARVPPAGSRVPRALECSSGVLDGTKRRSGSGLDIQKEGPCRRQVHHR